MEYQYWVKLDNDNQPEYFYRYDKNDLIEVWHQGEWHETRSSIAEFEGLGGATEFRPIRDEDAEKAIARFTVELNH